MPQARPAATDNAVPTTINRQVALRLISAALGLPILLGAIWAGPPLFSFLAAGAAAVAAWELTRMANNVGKHPPTLVTITWAIALVVVGHVLAEDFSPRDTTRGLVAAVAFAYVTWQVRYARSRVRGSDLRIAVGIALYTGGLLAFAPLLRGLEQGREWSLLALLVTFASDTSAFYVGRKVGRTPLAPAVSPGKTREGAAGGLAGAVIACAAIAGLLRLPVGLPSRVILGLLIGVAAQLGDLAESWMKRAAKVKDSGTLIPGHGGVLDRLDSIVPNLALMYSFVIWGVQ